MRAQAARARARLRLPAALMRCIAALTLVASVPTSAGSLAVSPLKLTFSKVAGITSLTVENNGLEEALVQTETFAWNQNGGEHKLSPTEDVIAVPPVFRLAPGARQRIRVGLTREFTETREQTFRLMVTEVPTVVAPGVIAIAVRHSLPIFVQPSAQISAKLTIKLAPSKGLEIANNGSQHLRILRWRLRDGAGGILAEDTGPGYLLAGASQVVTIASQQFSSSTVFEADTESRTLKIAVGQ